MFKKFNWRFIKVKIDRAERFKKFMTERMKFRKMLGNCRRCGHTNPDYGKKAWCPDCRERQKMLKANKRRNKALPSEAMKRLNRLEKTINPMKPGAIDDRISRRTAGILQRLDRLERLTEWMRHYDKEHTVMLKRLKNIREINQKLKDYETKMKNETEWIDGNLGLYGHSIDIQSLRQMSHVYNKQEEI
jgi:uncharacterized Zn finger protein (UPF0148 family)